MLESSRKSELLKQALSCAGNNPRHFQMSSGSNTRAAAAPAAVDLFSKRDLMRNTGGANQIAGFEFQATTGLSESLKHERNFRSTVGSTGLPADDIAKKEWGSTTIWRNDVKASEREAAEVRTLTKHDLQRGAKDFKPNSSVIAAVAQSKKTRHMEVLDEYDRCLNLIVEEMSKATLACVRTVKQVPQFFVRLLLQSPHYFYSAPHHQQNRRAKAVRLHGRPVPHATQPGAGREGVVRLHPGPRPARPVDCLLRRHCREHRGRPQPQG
jgi:hypothetical protein